MRISRRKWDGEDPAALAAELRGLAPSLDQLKEDVASIIAEVGRGGDKGVLEICTRLGDPVPERIAVAPERIAAAAEQVDAELLDALKLAATNIRAVAETQLSEPHTTVLDAGQSVELREIPVGAAGVYAPGGRAAYPSTVLMCCVAASVAGVGRIAVATPAAAGGEPAAVVLAACAVAGVEEVYAIGGAQAIAALALGTETIAAVDVIAGPGNRYVQEAKRQLVGGVGIDGIAGPSELMVIAGETANLDWVALDLCAQGEHGDDTLLVAAAVESSAIDWLEQRVGELAAERPSVADAPLALIAVPDTDSALALAEALAPEHLEIAAEDAPLLAERVTTSGCVFLGETGSAAFGDYVAGSNHVLPTGGAGRFQGPLGPGTFRRRISTVTLAAPAAAALAGPGATLAEAEGFPVHGESMRARAGKGSDREPNRRD
ncbi:MAG: histidinol dehydrogenase [Solirubrobacterales bacterium]